MGRHICRKTSLCCDKSTRDLSFEGRLGLAAEMTEIGVEIIVIEGGEAG